MKEKVYVSRRFDRDPNLGILFYGYSETVRSKSVTIGNKTSCTMICKNINTHKRLIKVGWKDCTEEYYKDLEIKEKELESKSEKNEEKTKRPRGRPKKTKRK